MMGCSSAVERSAVNGVVGGSIPPVPVLGNGLVDGQKALTLRTGVQFLLPHFGSRGVKVSTDDCDSSGYRSNRADPLMQRPRGSIGTADDL